MWVLRYCIISINLITSLDHFVADREQDHFPRPGEMQMAIAGLPFDHLIGTSEGSETLLRRLDGLCDQGSNRHRPYAARDRRIGVAFLDHSR